MGEFDQKDILKKLFMLRYTRLLYFSFPGEISEKCSGYRKPIPSPSGQPPWDRISEKYCMVVNGERQQIFSFELCPELHI